MALGFSQFWYDCWCGDNRAFPNCWEYRSNNGGLLECLKWYYPVEFFFYSGRSRLVTRVHRFFLGTVVYNLALLKKIG